MMERKGFKIKKIQPNTIIWWFLFALAFAPAPSAWCFRIQGPECFILLDPPGLLIFHLFHLAGPILLMLYYHKLVLIAVIIAIIIAIIKKINIWKSFISFIHKVAAVKNILFLVLFIYIAFWNLYRLFVGPAFKIVNPLYLLGWRCLSIAMLTSIMFYSHKMLSKRYKNGFFIFCILGLIFLTYNVCAHKILNIYEGKYCLGMDEEEIH